jgi:hypothetical protein
MQSVIVGQAVGAASTDTGALHPLLPFILSKFEKSLVSAAA